MPDGVPCFVLDLVEHRLGRFANEDAVRWAYLVCAKRFWGLKDSVIFPSTKCNTPSLRGVARYLGVKPRVKWVGLQLIRRLSPLEHKMLRTIDDGRFNLDTQETREHREPHFLSSIWIHRLSFPPRRSGRVCIVAGWWHYRSDT